ncbi:hypothetical protein CI109_105305 [Kwoniella shandongensis]|uniref:Phytase-like domain-containing protein n=1 Tax=Kwoniella shandongensis TaxID=1734106 RepID=A0A5M6BUQ4_9TREE|nr:uncharacterized protein CI109_004988 [Kwoniella shandongensis]KAA5526598.1 hypothetical protein CI109_004988 [Kwoniella shandongensis]
MRSTILTISPLFLVAPFVDASPIKSKSTHQITARHVIEGRQFGHGSTIAYGNTLASTSVYLEGSDSLTLYTSSNFTTLIVETPSTSTSATLLAGWGSQPIYNLGAGYILGVPTHIYADWSFPNISADELPLKVCTYVYPEPQGGVNNVTLPSRDNFDVDSFATALGLEDAVAEFCIKVGSAVTSSSSVGPAVPNTTTAAGVPGGAITTSEVAVSSSAVVISSSTPSTIPSVTATSSFIVPPQQSSAPAVPSSGYYSSAVSSGVVPSSESVPTVSAGSHSSSSLSATVVSVTKSIYPSSAPPTTVSATLTSSSSGPATTASASSVLPTIGSSSLASATFSANATTVAPSSIPTNGTSITVSTTATSTVPPTNSTTAIPTTTANATSTSIGPNPAYQTNVTFAGKTYINKGLVGFGAIPGDAVDSFGETIGGIGSAIALKSFEKQDDSYTGTILVQPDRGHNTATTTDFIARHHSISFTLNPYYNSTKLQYQDAKSTFQLNYESTVRYFEADGTPTTGLDALAYRNSTPIQPIASASYDRISTDAEGFVLNADGTFWVSDEYGPYIWKYSADGTLLSTIVPPEAVLPYRNGSLWFDAEGDNPDTGRVPNQGFEGLTASPDGKTLYALLQSGTVQDLDSNGEGRFTRLYVYDVSGTPTLKHAYVLELPVTNGKAKALKQSDFIWISDNTFLVLSRDGKGNGDDDPESKHKDFLLFNLDGATDIVNTDYTDGVVPVSLKGKLDSNIRAIVPTEFIDMIDDTQLKRFGLHNDGAFDVSLINSKWESSALASIQDPEYPNDYFLFSFSDNDFITINGFEAGQPYSDAYGHTLDNQALVWRVTLP